MSGFVKTRFETGETAVTIAAHQRYVGAAVDGVLQAREEIRRRISADAFFMTTFEPYEADISSAGDVVAQMCDASLAAGVGPMAAVAGSVAKTAVDSMIARGCEHCWVDNGGDVALGLSEPITVEVFTGSGQATHYGFEVGPADGIGGICSSSGTLGHSISLGSCDVCTVLADTAPLADALATAIGNRVRTSSDLETCFEPFQTVAGFVGGLVVFGDDVAVCGAIPEIVEVEHNHGGITAHSRMSSRRFIGDGPHGDSTQEVRH